MRSTERACCAFPAAMLLWMVSGSGCSAFDVARGPRESADTSAPTGTASDATPPADTDTQPGADSTADAIYFSLDGRLSIRDGAVDLERSSLTLGYWIDSEAPLCTEDYTLLQAEPIAVAEPGAPLLSSWDLALHGTGNCASAPQPTNLTLGIGSYDAQLDPAADYQGIDTSTVYGLYLQPEEASLWVFGIAGTPANFAGTAEVSVNVPLADGNYDLDGLHLLPLQ